MSSSELLSDMSKRRLRRLGAAGVGVLLSFLLWSIPCGTFAQDVENDEEEDDDFGDGFVNPVYVIDDDEEDDYDPVVVMLP